MRNFFANIPDSLEESGRMDGANDFVIFLKILLPISKPVLATIALFYAVGYWNNYFSTVVYINSRDKWALQAVLRDIVSSASQAMERQGVTITELKSMTPQTVTMATVVVATVPILVVYPFIQKYFIQGIMVGSLKG
jgi:putative aldouronate transport system permease protein